MSFTIIGYIGKSYGLGGKFYLSEPKLNAVALRSLKYVYVGNGVEPDEVHALLSVEERGARLCIKLEKVDSKELAIRLTHKALFITDKQAKLLPELEEDISYIGFRVFQDGIDLGEVTELLQQPAHDIITFTTMNGSEVMVPFVDEFIESVDEKKGILHVQLLEGMLDDH
jgi:16S rRNA processing protein RimM